MSLLFNFVLEWVIRMVQGSWKELKLYQTHWLLGNAVDSSLFSKNIRITKKINRPFLTLVRRLVQRYMQTELNIWNYWDFIHRLLFWKTKNTTLQTTGSVSVRTKQYDIFFIESYEFVKGMLHYPTKMFSAARIMASVWRWASSKAMSFSQVYTHLSIRSPHTK